MKKDFPNCRYCGGQMDIREWVDAFFPNAFYYVCRCGARSPLESTPENAYETATQCKKL